MTTDELNMRMVRTLELQSADRNLDAVALCLSLVSEPSLKFAALYTIGVACVRLGSRELAVKFFEAAQAQRPDDEASAHALLVLTSGKTEGSAEYIQQVAKSDNGSIRTYCTYFDSNYSPRGVAMIESLLTHQINAEVFVLCLDPETFEVVSRLDDRVHAISIEELCTADLEFSKARTNRTRIEWYFTATAAFSNYVMTSLLKASRSLTYLDADLFFYGSPEPLHVEFFGKSAQVIEHNFPVEMESHKRYGRFNVGWISFSNDTEGLRILADYRTDCIAWCHDRTEGARFADQKYLDYWPCLYRRLCISKVAGANIALWNISRHVLHQQNSRFFVNSDPLIFFHFHGVSRSDIGKYQNKSGLPFTGALGNLFADYFSVLEKTERRISEVIPLSFQEIRHKTRSS